MKKIKSSSKPSINVGEIIPQTLIDVETKLSQKNSTIEIDENRDIISQIKERKNLFDEGGIIKKEFDRAKKKLLY